MISFSFMIFNYIIVYGDFMNKHIDTFHTIIEQSNSIVFFGGAGVSTESGIPDFRSKDGLYHQTYQYPPEEILSHHFFIQHTEEFFKFYRNKMNALDYQPNITHMKLAELEKKGKLQAIVTQNIDGLHQKAGSKTVYELHGSILRNYCTSCGKFYDAKTVFSSTSIPYCECGGIIKPDVVLYEEALDDSVIYSATYAISHCDTLIIAGTSLTVYPASSLIQYFKGNHLILINRERTPYDHLANLIIHENLGNVFQYI